MIDTIRTVYDRGVALAESRVAEAAALLVTRLALAGVFWRSARTKVEEGSWLTVSDTTTFLFAEEYGMPWPAVTGTIATYAEHILPLMVVLGLFTRIGAAGLLVMTMVIQLFVYPDAWWQTHILWTAMALVLIVRGGGLFSADALVGRGRRA